MKEQKAKAIKSNLAKPPRCHKIMHVNLMKFSYSYLSLGVILVVESIDSHSDLFVKPIATPFIRDRDEWPIDAPLQRQTHARALFRDGLDLLQLDGRIGPQSLHLDEKDTIVREHHQGVLAGQLQMSNVILVEIFAVVECLQPELAESFTLAVWADDAVYTDEAGETDTVEAILVEDGRGVAYTFRDVYAAHSLACDSFEQARRQLT